MELCTWMRLQFSDAPGCTLIAVFYILVAGWTWHVNTYSGAMKALMNFNTIVLVTVATGRLLGGRWQLIRDKIMQRRSMNSEQPYIIGDSGRISR